MIKCLIRVAIFYFCFISALTKNKSHDLECMVDTSRFENILMDIESLGYTTEKAMFLNQMDDLPGNTDGGYAHYTRSANMNASSYPYKMGALSAVLYHGCTPPQSAYFGYSTSLYVDGNIWLWAELDDVLNHNVIKTYNESGSGGFDDITTIITTANYRTYRDITSVYEDYNISKSRINFDKIPFQSVTRMGTDRNSSSFHSYLRVSLPVNYQAFNHYFANINSSQIANLYFIIKGNSTDELTQFVPNEKIDPVTNKDRICHNSSFVNNGSEYILESDLNQLLNFTISEMSNYRRYINKTMQIFGTEYNGYECIANRQLCGPGSTSEPSTMDCLYYHANEDALLTNDNLFMIIGVNHHNLGLSAYNEQTVFNESFGRIYNEYATVNNYQYNNSANAFEANNTDFSSFYAIMYARPDRCVDELVEKGVICVELEYNDLKRNEGLIFYGRAMLNPCTNTGPSKDQFLYQWLMEFSYDEYDEELDTEFGIIVILSIAAVFCVISIIFGCMYFMSKRHDMLLNKYYKSDVNRYDDGVALTAIRH